MKNKSHARFVVKGAKIALLLMVSAILGVTSFAKQAEAGAQQRQGGKRPNILLIVADDMGWSDIEPFGGEIRTPHIARLATEGIRFTQFYVGPACSPTRSMLLSGTDNHLAGMGTNAEIISEEQRGKFGYEGYLNDRVVSVAETLAASGYETFMAGKWHLGEKPEHWPDKRGFQQSFAMMLGGASHFGDEAAMCNDYYPIYAEDGKRTHTPDDFYSSTFYADKIIHNLKTRDESKPFFGYLAFTAPHDPIHVPDEWLNAYKGRYDAGPDALRKARFARQVEMGLFPKEIKLWQIPNAPKGHDRHIPPWQERPKAARAYSARVMEMYASMVELMDREVGRIIAYLKETGQYENTYVVFFSDNGANGAPMGAYPNTGEEWVARNSDNRLENIGRKGSRNAIGFEWAVTCNAPLRLIKGTIAEGGIRSPLIVTGPGVASGMRSDTILHVMDMAPTFLSIAGATHPQARDGKAILSMQGKSMLTCWTDEKSSIRSDTDHLSWELLGWRAARRGGWKATWLSQPFGQSKWELFNLKSDPGEAVDLSSKNPNKLQTLIRIYEDYVERCGVIESSRKIDM
jgi:arylsulfatase A-like enzyme